MQDGKKNLNRSVSDVRKTLEEDERGATEYDGIALFIQKPEVLQDHYIDLPGTSVEVGAESAVYLSGWGDRPKVICSHVGDADPSFGSASCGRIAA